MGFDFDKASQSFDSLPFQDRLSAVGNLVKNTFTVIGRDRDIVVPFTRMAIYHFIMVTTFFYGAMGWWYELPGEAWALVLAVLLFLYKHFYHNKQEIRLSWTVNETITGNDPDYAGATRASKGLKGQIRILAWLDIGMAVLRRAKSKEGGVVNWLINLFITGLREVWDLVNHYLLPSVAVDGHDIKPGIEKMKKLKDQVPESLVGVFGIDFLGSVIRRVTVPVYTGLFVIAALAGYFGTGLFPSYEIPFEGTPITLTPIPLVIALYFGKIFNNLFERTVTCIKVIYFTIFYAKITHPDSISEDLREELLNYLKLDQVDEVENLDSQEAAEGDMQAAPA
ncbi:MAG: hypothetical protein U5K31_08595 [Balneolaceae bacterium]|nr:hypothetical protein [Balneolaceae bacterium]